MLVEKRVAGIIRWLERLKQSYSSGAIESALMDAECARADLENLRQDVWAQVRPSAKNESAIFSFSGMMNFARVFSLALIIVMMSVMPLSREIYSPVIEKPKREQAKAQPIIVIRQYEAPAVMTSEKNEDLPQKKQIAQKRVSSKRTQPAKTAKTAAGTQILPEKTAKPSKTPQVLPYDKVYSLIQTGQRALKNNSTVIKIQ